MHTLSTPIQIGSLTVPNRVFLAPLAGVSDVPFRRICRELGAGLTFVEMLSAVAIAHKGRRTVEMCARHADEELLGVQLTGPRADLIASGIRTLDGLGFDVIDINMGCSVRKVISGGRVAVFCLIRNVLRRRWSRRARRRSVRFR